MRKRWKEVQTHICSTAISAEEYNLLIDEWAQTVYHHFCQLSQDQNLVPVTQIPSSVESAGA